MLSPLDRDLLRYAVRRGVVGLSDVRILCRCGEARARAILLKLSRLGYLQPGTGGGFVPTSVTLLEVSA